MQAADASNCMLFFGVAEAFPMSCVLTAESQRLCSVLQKDCERDASARRLRTDVFHRESAGSLRSLQPGHQRTRVHVELAILASRSCSIHARAEKTGMGDGPEGTMAL